MNSDDKKWMTLKECCVYLGLTCRALYCLVHRGAIPYYKQGRRLYFLKEELDQRILSNKQPSNPA